MDLAISAALMGGEGVIVSEASEISPDRLKALVAKLQPIVAGGTQVILTGHDLASLRGTDGVSLIEL